MEPSVEERLLGLEKQLRDVLTKLQPNSLPGWRSSLGMFDDRPLMCKIDEEGRRIREAERDEAAGVIIYAKNRSVTATEVSNAATQSRAEIWSLRPLNLRNCNSAPVGQPYRQ